MREKIVQSEGDTVKFLKARGIKGLINMLLERAKQAANDADGCLMITSAQALDLVYKGWFAEHPLKAVPSPIVTANTLPSDDQQIEYWFERSKKAEAEVARLLSELECDTVDEALIQIKFDNELSLKAANAIKDGVGLPENLWPSANERAFFTALQAEVARLTAALVRMRAGFAASSTDEENRLRAELEAARKDVE